MSHILRSNQKYILTLIQTPIFQPCTLIILWYLLLPCKQPDSSESYKWVTLAWMSLSVIYLSLSLSLPMVKKEHGLKIQFLVVNCEKIAIVINYDYNERSWCGRENCCCHLNSQHFSKFLPPSCVEQRESFSYVPSNVIFSILNVIITPPWRLLLEFSSDSSLPCELCLWICEAACEVKRYQNFVCCIAHPIIYIPFRSVELFSCTKCYF